jgi:catechol 2,3-dioxygenase-like lactoylglutathione lyase family enzyme
VTDLANEQPEPAAPARVGRLASVSIDCADPAAMADFYAPLLGMHRVFETPDGAIIALSDGANWVTLMRVENYLAPTWPNPGQLKQMHLDVAVTDLPGAVSRGIALGAREADQQAAPDVWRVLFDPAGHPFCLTTVTVD